MKNMGNRVEQCKVHLTLESLEGVLADMDAFKFERVGAQGTLVQWQAVRRSGNLAQQIGLDHLPLGYVTAVPRGNTLIVKLFSEGAMGLMPHDFTPEASAIVNTIKEAEEDDLKTRVKRTGVVIAPDRSETVSGCVDSDEKGNPITPERGRPTDDYFKYYYIATKSNLPVDRFEFCKLTPYDDPDTFSARYSEWKRRNKLPRDSRGKRAVKKS